MREAEAIARKGAAKGPGKRVFVSTFCRGSTNAAYFAARHKRDRTDIA
jgi:hypothetical protein